MRAPRPDLPTQMQVVFCDGRMVGGSSSEGDERGRGFAGKVGGVFAGWEGLTVYVNTPFLEGCKCRGDTTTTALICMDSPITPAAVTLRSSSTKAWFVTSITNSPETNLSVASRSSSLLNVPFSQ